MGADMSIAVKPAAEWELRWRTMEQLLQSAPPTDSPATRLALRRGFDIVAEERRQGTLGEMDIDRAMRRLKG